jgi:hypothetical protein
MDSLCSFRAETLGGSMGENQLAVLPTQEKPSWKQRLLRLVAGLFVFETISGLVMWLGPFNVSAQFMALFHTALGLVFVVPFIITQFQHFPVGWAKDDRFQRWLGVCGCAIVALSGVSGLALTFQGIWGTRISWTWHYIHLVSSLATIPVVLIHVTPLARKITRTWRKVELHPPLPVARELVWVPLILVVATLGAAQLYSPVNYLDFPAVGSHRWSASDQLYQAVQDIMMKEEGAHATRYCAGCHDPVSLLSGYKDAGRGLDAPGYDEGASCLLCHGIQKVDIQGNGNYIWRPPNRYVFENKEGPAAVFLSEYLIRTFPDHADADARTLRGLPQAVHRRRGEQLRLGAVAEPVRRMEGQPLVP